MAMEQAKKTETGLDWVARYLAVILLSLLLAAALGNMDLFIKTSIGGKLAASHIVQFLGYGAALVTLWVLGQRVTIELQQHQGKWSFLHHLILPAVSLVTVSLAYSVLLLLLKPVLNSTLQNIYNWTFILAILACAGWLVMAVLNQSGSLTALFTELQAPKQSRLCAACGASGAAEDKFCKHCGKAFAETA
jgi:hypothetical protein